MKHRLLAPGTARRPSRGAEPLVALRRGRNSYNYKLNFNFPSGDKAKAFAIKQRSLGAGTARRRFFLITFSLRLLLAKKKWVRTFAIKR